MRKLLVMPASPALLPELAPAHEPSWSLLRAARAALGASLAEGETAGGVDIVGSQDRRWRTDLAGSFRAWGAPQVSVGDGHFLPELVARYVLGDLAAVACSRATIGGVREGVVTIVLADGSAGLGPGAPLGEIARAPEADSWCRALLGGQLFARDSAEPASPAALNAAGVLEPDLWCELARLRPAETELLAQDTSLGVGRYVARWALP